MSTIPPNYGDNNLDGSQINHDRIKRLGNKQKHDSPNSPKTQATGNNRQDLVKIPDQVKFEKIDIEPGDRDSVISHLNLTRKLQYNEKLFLDEIVDAYEESNTGRIILVIPDENKDEFIKLKESQNIEVAVIPVWLDIQLASQKPLYLMFAGENEIYKELLNSERVGRYGLKAGAPEKAKLVADTSDLSINHETKKIFFTNYLHPKIKDESFMVYLGKWIDPIYSDYDVNFVHPVSEKNINFAYVDVREHKTPQGELIYTGRNLLIPTTTENISRLADLGNLRAEKLTYIPISAQEKTENTELKQNEAKKPNFEYRYILDGQKAGLITEDQKDRAILLFNRRLGGDGKTMIY